MSPSPRQVLRFLLAAGSLSLAASCIILPTPEHGLLEGRGAISDQGTAFLKPGITSLEEVLLRFGEPDATLRGDTFLAYKWTVSRGYILVGGYGGGGMLPIPKDHLLLLEFDGAARLLRWEFKAGAPRTSRALLNDWTRQGKEPAMP